MKRTLLTPLAFVLLGLAAVAPAQTAPAQTAPAGTNTLTLPTLPDVLGRLSFTYSVDPFGKGADGSQKVVATQAALYRFQTVENLFPTVLKGRLKTNVDVDAVLGASGGGANLGFAGVLTGSWKLQYSATGKVTIVPTLGPALLYNTSGPGMHLGLVLGLGFKL